MVLPENRVVSIPVSKFKLVLLLLGAVGCVASAIWIFYLSRYEPVHILILVRTVSLFCIIFFGLCGLYSTKKLLNSNPGLVLDSAGIIDNSGAVSVGRISWQDLEGINITWIQGQRFITLYVTDPQKYLQRGGFLKRQVNALNYKLYSSPIHISANTLNISFNELIDLVSQYYERYLNNVRWGWDD